MALYRLLQNSALRPEEIERLKAAYEQTLVTLGLKNRTDPITQIVADKIIEIGRTGIKDPGEISKRAIEAIGK
jgi:hypothetical protein